MINLIGKTAVITGASSGIGAATARALHQCGANVALGARRGHLMKEMVADLGEVRSAWSEMDVCDTEDVNRLFDSAQDAFGQVDILVANAGMGAYGGVLDLPDDHVRRLIETNLTGVIWCVRAALRYFPPSGGDIVIVSSVAGLRGRPDEAVYAATKHGLVGLAGSLDRELRERGVRVMTLCPGATDTEFAMGHGRTPDMPALATMLQPADVADAIVTMLRQPTAMRTLMWSMRSMASAS